MLPSPPYPPCTSQNVTAGPDPSVWIWYLSLPQRIVLVTSIPSQEVEKSPPGKLFTMVQLRISGTPALSQQMPPHWELPPTDVLFAISVLLMTGELPTQ